MVRINRHNVKKFLSTTIIAVACVERIARRKMVNGITRIDAIVSNVAKLGAVSGNPIVIITEQ